MNKLAARGQFPSKVMHTQYPYALVSRNTKRFLLYAPLTNPLTSHPLFVSLFDHHRGKGINDVVIRLLRDVRMKMNAYEPQYRASVSINTTDQRMKAAEMNSAYGKNRKKGDGGESVATQSTVRYTMKRQSSGISPPQRMQRAKEGDNNRR